MPTNLDKHWIDIVASCKERISKDKKAGIKSVISSLSLPSPTTEDIQIIDGYLTNNGEYKSISIDNEIFVSKDHNYKLNNLVKTNEEDKDDPISGMTTSLLKMVSTLTKPIYDYAKSQMKLENMNATKENILEEINEQLNKHREILSLTTPESKEHMEAEKILIKYEHLKTLTDWSMGTVDSSLFKYFQFT